ncbi:MAG: cytochrome oxidase subunit III, partial [Vicingaceae bacterium]|nr:cytochrome oxidase subunit III [Vicingaceae bacterium]
MSHTAVVDSKTAWAGDNNSPFGAGYGKLMMWFFLMSDALSFTGFLAAYGF